MKCQNCNAEFEGNFCPYCGSPAGTMPAAGQAQENAAPPVQDPTQIQQAPPAQIQGNQPSAPQYQAPSQQYQQQNYQYQQPYQQQPNQQPYQQPYQQPTIIINNANTNQNVNGAMGPMVSQKSWIATLLLCIFLGGLGVHRFYVGKVGTGLLYLFTGSLCGIGYLYDLIKIITGTFTDGNGFPIHN